MDEKARNKALFRAKLSAVNKDKRIDSPLVRYNESDQPVCRVCDVILKSEAQWDAHQASRKHKEAIDNFKASAAAAKRNGTPQKESEEPRQQGATLGHVSRIDSAGRPAPAARAPSGLPPGFFDGNVRGDKTGAPAEELRQQGATVGHVSSIDSAGRPAPAATVPSGLPPGFFDGDVRGGKTGAPVKSVSTKKLGEEAIVEVQPSRNGPSVSESNETAKPSSASDKRPSRGALPEGFFDNKEADLRARGIQPVKVDKEVEYKEFEKSIQEDLLEVDNRMEEEEIDAAEFIEEAESVEQKTYQERVGMLRKKKLELAANKSVKRRKGSEGVVKRTIQEEPSSDDESDEDFSVDWRAQHI